MMIQIFLLLLLCSGVLGKCTFKRDVSISGPDLEALSGSCLLMPCTFTLTKTGEALDISKPVVGIWMKSAGNNGPVMLNSAMPKDTDHMKMIGDLRRKNCTTLFSNLNPHHSDKYYFRIENGEFKATDFCKPLQINVTDSPWTPSIQVSGPAGAQREGQAVRITCSAVTPCPDSPPELTWDLQQKPLHFMDRNSDGTFTSRIQREMTLSERHDGLQLRCSAAYPVRGGVRTAHQNLTLRVEYSPTDTSARLSVDPPLSVGQTVTLNCSSRARPPVQSFSWFRTSSHGTERVSGERFYSFIYSNTSEGEYFCQARNPLGEQNSTVIKLQTNVTLWRPVLGGGMGLLSVICLAVCVWYLVSKRQAREEAQVRPPQTEPQMEHSEEDTVHYGDIHFLGLKPKRGAGPAHGGTEEPEETVYSQVRVSKAAAPLLPAEDLYATVKRN